MGADTDATDEAELIRRYLENRDENCFDRLVARYRNRVMYVALSVLGPDLAGDAEDVVQETFIKADSRLAGFRGQSAFGTWLYRLAYNQALDQRKRLLRRGRRDSSSHAVATASRRDARDAGDDMIADERNRALHAALARLPQPGQTVLRAYYWLELPVGEIAELLGVPAGTVKSYLHRGRARLARLLDGEGTRP